MTVTGILEHSKGKYKIFLNDAFAFVLYKGDLRKYDISEGKELSDTDIDNIKNEVLIKRCRIRSLYLLKSRDYTEQSLRNKLKEGLYPMDVIDDSIEYVKSYRYIDDKRYAASFVRMHAQNDSRTKIAMKLKEKGVVAEYIEEAFAEYEDEYGNPEAEQLHKLLGKLCPNPSELDYAGRQKLFARLYRRGYSLEAIENAYADYTGGK